MYKKIAYISLYLITSTLSAHKADLIIFSYDRPLQLFALLESIERYITNLGETHVIYRASDDRYDHAYQKVFKQFSWTLPIKQGANPQSDFKRLLMKSFHATSNEYILFAVDDIIVQDHIDCAQCIDALHKSSAYGFYLRLGKNTTYCYMLNKTQRIPPLREIVSDIYAWTFSDAHHDWAYPNTVDMTIYRKRDIEDALSSLEYQTPNRCEGAWSIIAKQVMHKKGLCFAHSKIVNLPLNRVQRDFVQNRNENSISTMELLELFERGFKMDIDPLHTINNISCHMAYTPTFIACN